jgi:hypothetical protein
LARAKQTDRAEARRRYRQSVAPLADGAGDDLAEEEAAPPASRASQPVAKSSARPSDPRPPSGRLGFMQAFRTAYHQPNFREDLRTLPKTVQSRGFLAAIAMVVVGGVLWYVYPVYSGSLTLWELLVLPGSALAPQLVAGFFAPRASYLLGMLVGIVQPIVYLVVNSSARVQEAYLARGVDIPGITMDQIGLAFFNSVAMGALFAAMAAWYRRFLALSSPRGQTASRSSSRTSSKSTSRRTANR